jgi:hypothetical protein
MLPRTARAYAQSRGALQARIIPLTSPARPQLQHRAVATAVIRSPARPARVMGDSCRQVSWLAAPCASLPPSRRLPAVAFGATLAAYSCGGSRGFEAEASHRVPFSPLRSKWARNETVTLGNRSNAGARCQCITGIDYTLPLRHGARATVTDYLTASLTMPSSRVSMARSAAEEAASPAGVGRR